MDEGVQVCGGKPNEAFNEPLKTLFTCSTNIYHYCDQKAGPLARREDHKSSIECLYNCSLVTGMEPPLHISNCVRDGRVL